ncbi:hypothetical protein VYU27_005912 [Nannochloropsis oceanica]
MALAALVEISPEAAKEVGVKLKKEHGLDSADVQGWEKPSLQSSLFPRLSSGVLPLGPSQVSMVYRYYLLKLRVLSEKGARGEVGAEETGGYPYSVEPCRVQVDEGKMKGREEEDEVVRSGLSTSPGAGRGGKGGGGGGCGGGASKRGVGEQVEKEEDTTAGSRYAFQGEGKSRKEGRKKRELCQRVLKAAVYGMGDDVFQELCDFVHLQDT